MSEISDSMDQPVQRIVPAVARAFDILELFLDEPGPLAAPDVAARLGLPRSSVHELLRTLAARGYLECRADSPNRFVLGLRAFELGNAYAADLDLTREGQHIARDLVAACDETASVAVLDGADVVYVVIVESTQPVRSVGGRRAPAYCTGSGKILLAGLPDAEVVARHAGREPFPRLTPNTIATLGQLRSELDRVRARGVAIDDRETHLNQRCVAAPIYDHADTLVAALTLSAPASRVEGDRLDELEGLVRRGAAELSRRLGHRARGAGHTAARQVRDARTMGGVRAP